MKKHLPILMLLCILCVFSVACSDKNAPLNESIAPQIEATTPQDTGDSNVVQAADEIPNTDENPAEASKVDLDLTSMSKTMIFAEVYKMTNSPDEFLGKTIKVNGRYNTSHSDESGRDYHFILVSDVAGCCQQGIEFIINDDYSNTDDYPDDNNKIEVTGVFKSYKVFEYTHYYLDADNNAVTILN